MNSPSKSAIAPDLERTLAHIATAIPAHLRESTWPHLSLVIKELGGDVSQLEYLKGSRPLAGDPSKRNQSGPQVVLVFEDSPELGYDDTPYVMDYDDACRLVGLKPSSLKVMLSANKKGLRRYTKLGYCNMFRLKYSAGPDTIKILEPIEARQRRIDAWKPKPRSRIPRE